MSGVGEAGEQALARRGRQVDDVGVAEAQGCG